MADRWDAIVVGSGPNGLAAAIALAQAGRSVLVLEAADGDRRRPAQRRAHAARIPSRRLLGDPPPRARLAVPAAPAAARSTGSSSPIPRSRSRIRSTTARQWRCIAPWTRRPRASAPTAMPIARCCNRSSTTGKCCSRTCSARCASHDTRAPTCASRARDCARPAASLARASRARAHAPCWPATPRTRCARSAAPATAGFGLALMMLGHGVGWPVAAGGSQAIADAMASLLRSLGGEIETGREVRSLADVRGVRAVLFDLTPRQIAGGRGRRIAAPLPARTGALPLRACRVQARLRARRPRAVDGTGVPPRGHRPSRRIARGDRASRGRGRTRPPRIAPLRARRSAEPLRSRPRPGRRSARCGRTAMCPTAPGSTPVRRSRLRSSASRRAFATWCAPAACSAPPTSRRATRTTSAATSTAARPTCASSSHGPSRAPCRTPRPTRACSCARRRRPPGGGVHGMCGWHAAQAALRGALR